MARFKAAQQKQTKPVSFRLKKNKLKNRRMSKKVKLQKKKTKPVPIKYTVASLEKKAVVSLWALIPFLIVLLSLFVGNFLMNKRPLLGSKKADLIAGLLATAVYYGLSLLLMVVVKVDPVTETSSQ